MRGDPVKETARAAASHRQVRPTRSDAVAAVRWLGVYIAAVALPLLALLPGTSLAGRGFAWDFSMALGYAALAMLGVQFALTARFRRATAPFGIDIVFYFHRYLALCALLIALAHYAILRIDNPAALGAADPRVAPLHMSAGRVALLLFVVVVVLSLARRLLRLEYDRWRITHAVLATLALALAIWHVFGAAHYLDRPWKTGLWVGWSVFWLGLIAYVRVLRPWRVARQPYRIAEVRQERGHVWTLALESPGGERLRFAPGQFAWLTLRASPFAMREHPFSIASSALRPERIEFGIKELGDFTATIKDIRPGEIAYVDAPYGSFGIDQRPGAPGYVFVAGGIGIAPILSMLRTLADRGDPRPLTLFYGNRVWERVAYREELEALSRRLALRVVHVLLEPPADWSGERGFIARDVLARHLPAEAAAQEFFLCGPTPMTQDVERSLAALGVPASRIHSEIFDWV